MVMCRVLQVSRSGYYAWIDRPVSLSAQDNERLVVLIRASHAASGGIYGSPRVTADLREAGERCGKNRVARLMQIHEIRGATGCKRPRPDARGGKRTVIYVASPGVKSAITWSFRFFSRTLHP